MDIVQRLLPVELKNKATAAFRDNTRLAEMTDEEREKAAQGYEQIARAALGDNAELARLYNLERAKFLRGAVKNIASTARHFGDEIGFPG